MTTRVDVVAAARGWIGTPWQHQQRMKGVGVDCIGLVIGVARELGLVAPQFDVNGYGRVPDGKSLLGACDLHMVPVPRHALRPGDVIVVATSVDPQHVGILTNHRNGVLGIVHASNSAAPARVIETRLMWSRVLQFRRGYALPGVH